MFSPLVSVNMCTYNSSRYVGETLQSVFAQTLQDFEIVIVDDGSTDGTPERIEEQFPDERITIVRQRHVTLRVARPLALAHSRGEFIAFLDSDDLWTPSKLERQVAAARAAPDAGLIFCDADLIDASGRPMGRFSDQFDYGAIDLCGTRGHVELLRRGNFIASPTPFAPAAAIRAVGGFNSSYRHVNDYELWLRLARRYPLLFIDDALALYRIHDGQFTQRRPEVTLPEQCALTIPIIRSASYPPAVRIALGDNILGQHRLAWRLMWRQRRYALAVRTMLGMCRFPDRLRDSWRHALSRTVLGPPVEAAIRGYHTMKDTFAQGRDRGKDLIAQGIAHGVNAVNIARLIVTRAKRAPRRLARALRGEPRMVAPATAPSQPAAADAPVLPTGIWIDGTALGFAQTGYFNLISESIRRLAHHPSRNCLVHVTTQAAGRAALRQRLGNDVTAVRFHRAGLRSLHWRQIHELLFGWPVHVLVALAAAGLLALGIASASVVAIDAAILMTFGQILVVIDELLAKAAEASSRPRLRYAERLVRFLWRRLPAPRWRAPAPGTVEVIFWRGRFTWRDSHRIAVVQDMTTRIHPELHTPGNVAEFEEFLGYAQRHAHHILTVSEHSRRDIIDRVAVCPDNVVVIPQPVHPQYVQPHVSRGFVAVHHITSPYVLCVAAIEPRKNLRRLVRAFEMLKEEDAARGHLLVLVGPQGWDPGFREFLVGSDAYPRVRMPGFVPTDHLPSLYHFASAVICPSVYEGFGIPVMEAMCSSAVVLASRVSSLPEVLGSDGIMFEPYDTEDMAGALLRALTLSPAEEATYRRRCRQRAEAHLERVIHEGPLPGFGITALVERT